MRQGVVGFGRLRDAALSDEDQRMLSRLIQRALELSESDDDKDTAKADRINVGVFEDMLARNRPLSDAQRGWVKDVYEKVFDDPQYANLASSGRLCRGREVPTPKVLLPQNLPKKPPGRM